MIQSSSIIKGLTVGSSERGPDMSAAAAEETPGDCEVPSPVSPSNYAKETDTRMDAASILGEKLDKLPSVRSTAMHAMLHKPLLIFCPAIPAALVMWVTCMCPPCTITEAEMPFAGFLPWLTSRQDEWVMGCVFICLIFQGTCFIGPGLCMLEFMDAKACLITFVGYVIPYGICTSLVVFATSCDPSDLMLVLYIIVVDGVVGVSLYVAMCALSSNRMRGYDRWWNPLELRRRSVVELVKDIVGFSAFCVGQVGAIVYIAIDVIWIAPNPVLAPYRPLFTAVVKKTSYSITSQSFRLLGDSYKVWGLLMLDCCLGLNTAFAAVQCTSWGSLLIFTLADLLAFSARIWCHSGKGNTTTLGYYLRRYFLFGKSPPPRGIQKPVYRGFEIVSEGLGLSIGFSTMVVVYFMSAPSFSPYPMLRQLCFPQGHQSFMFLLTMFASDLVQDLVGIVWVVHKIEYDFGTLLCHPFAKRNRPFFLCQAAAWWSLTWLVQFGWIFQRLEVGPFRANM